MPTRYVYDIKCEAQGRVAPRGQALYIVYYCTRHDLCNLCHHGMPSEVLHLYKLLLHEVRKLIFCSNLRFVYAVLLARTLYDIKCVAALLIHPRKVT